MGGRLTMGNGARRGLAAVALALALAVAPAGQEKPTVPVDDYGKWETLSGAATLSPDGRWLVYGVARVNDDSELRLTSLAQADAPAWTTEPSSLEGSSSPSATEPVRVYSWGRGPVFSADARWLVWAAGVSADERERLEEEDEPVRLGVGLLAMATGDERTFDDVRGFDFDETGRFLALHGYAPEEPEGKGADLRLIALETGAETTFGNVGEYAWSDTGSLLALTVATGSEQGNGVQLYDPVDGRLRALDTSGSMYRQLGWREADAAAPAVGTRAADLAVLRSVDPAGTDGAAHHVLAWRGLDTDEPRRFELDPETAGVGAELEVVRHMRPRWSEDGRLLAVGLRPAAEEEVEDDEADTDQDSDAAPDGGEPSAEPEDEDAADDDGDDDDEDAGDDEEIDLPEVQIWHTSDVRLFPEQQASADRDAERTLLAVWHLDADRVVPIGSDLAERVELLDGWDHGVERVETPYPWGRMFGRRYHDVWVVDVASGARELALERVRYSWASPGGRYLLHFDGADYWSTDLRSDERTNITDGLAADFANLDYDTPTDLPPPRGVGGWVAGDAAVLLYDKYDVWRVIASGGGGVRLTDGGDEEIVHRVVDLDPDEDAIDSTRPVYLSLHGEWSEKRGYARIAPESLSGAGGRTAERLVFVDKMVSGLRVADNAEVYVYRAEARDDPSDYFVAGPDLSASRQVTRTNVFQDGYAWGGATLIDYESEAGRRLQAALVYPANHDPQRRYPMIVYTYEILSSGVHGYEPPSERDCYNFTAWSQHGYFVLLPDIVYRARDPGVSALEAVRPAVAKTVEMGLVDADRVGLIGHSWGGYQATYLPTRTNIFAASVAGAPLTDFVSFMGAIHWNAGVPEVDHWETGQARMEVPFWEDPEAHRRNSPIHEVHNLETPLLMAFGDDDGVVDWDQGTEFYNFARRAGKQMVLLVYEGEDHGFRDEANQVDYHRRILEWFGHYLKGETAPRWITEGIPVDELEGEQRRVATRASERP